jgi:aspartyl-tRNA(Asn)/glutamyl-tRNA(Gln) amidotransferase subunit B
MRSKETEADYRYFHEPDLLPIRIDDNWKNSVLAQLPELPLQRRRRFIEQYSLPEYDADILTGERDFSEYYEAAVGAYRGDPKRVSNWIMNDVLGMMNERGLRANGLSLTPAYLAEIIRLVDSGKINNSTGTALLEKVEESGLAPLAIVEAEGLARVSDDAAIREICEEVVRENPEQAATYQSGKVTLIGWFVGQVMAKSRGKADPQLARVVLEELLTK